MKPLLATLTLLIFVGAGCTCVKQETIMVHNDSTSYLIKDVWGIYRKVTTPPYDTQETVCTKYE